MAIQKIKTKKGTVRYRVQLCINRQRASKVFDTHLDAAIWQDETEKLLKGGKSIGDRIAPGDMLFSEAADRFILETKGTVSQAHRRSYDNSSLQFNRSFGTHAKMSEITPQIVASHVLKRMSIDGVGPSSIRTELSFLRMLFIKAVEWGVSYPSPEKDLARPKARMKSREDRLDRIIKPDEMVVILNEAKRRKNNLHLFLRFLLYTGMRPSEAAQLYWERLPPKEEKEALRGMWPVGYVDLERGGFSKIGTKTNSRFVPAHQEAIKVIGQLEETAQNGKKLVFLDDDYITRPRAYLFYRRSMQLTLQKAIVNGVRIRQDINFYSFRHTARSAMETCGISTSVAETIIGHNDRSFKFTYIHLSDADLVREISKLEYVGLILR